MKSVLLVNMGSPASEKEMKTFLGKMFRDKAIINAPWLIRYLLSFIISNLRYKHSWKKYLMIGGSPLIESMNSLRLGLTNKLTGDYLVSCAYSYSPPYLLSELRKHCRNGVTDFTVVSMYPHNSFSTTGSIESIIDKAKKSFKNCHVKFIKSYYTNSYFISFWTDIIEKHISECVYQKPHLLFSAHAIPEYQIKQGDSYTYAIEESAKIIASKLNLPYSVSYQSKIGKVKWAGPDTISHLSQLHNNNVEQVIIVPVSFINENLETLYDIDIEIIPHAKNIGIKEISRVIMPSGHKLLVNTFFDLIKQ